MFSARSESPCRLVLVLALLVLALLLLVALAELEQQMEQQLLKPRWAAAVVQK